MMKPLRTLATAVVCLGIMCLGVPVALADGGSPQPQLIDVSNQWSNLANQIANAQQHNQPFGHGQLSTGAICGYGAPSQVFKQFGDNGYYALPAQGDLAGWTLNNVSISTNHDPFSAAQYSIALAGNAQVTTPAYCIGAANRRMTRSPWNLVAAS